MNAVIVYWIVSFAVAFFVKSCASNLGMAVINSNFILSHVYGSMKVKH